MKKTALYQYGYKGFNRLGESDFSDEKEKVVGRAGFEPATNWLKANCSTN